VLASSHVSRRARVKSVLVHLILVFATSAQKLDAITFVEEDLLFLAKIFH
jgi:hypothetical protein